MSRLDAAEIFLYENNENQYRQKKFSLMIFRSSEEAARSFDKEKETWIDFGNTIGSRAGFWSKVESHTGSSAIDVLQFQSTVLTFPWQYFDNCPPEYWLPE